MVFSARKMDCDISTFRKKFMQGNQCPARKEGSHLSKIASLTNPFITDTPINHIFYVITVMNSRELIDVS
jgi:hypothetical protein